MDGKRRLIVLISGSGTNLQAILDALDDRLRHCEVVLVVSNRKAAYGLERAQKAGKPTLYFPLKPYEARREDYDRDLATELEKHSPDLIVLAGWMHILSPACIDRFPNKIINLHPALPGEYPGTHSIDRAFADFQAGTATRSGVMVHYVVPEIDAGETVGTSEVPFLEGDTAEAFEARMHAAEHTLLVQSIAKLTSH